MLADLARAEQWPQLHTHGDGPLHAGTYVPMPQLQHRRLLSQVLEAEGQELPQRQHRQDACTGKQIL